MAMVEDEQTSPSAASKVVTIHHSQLLDKYSDTSAELEEGFGPRGLGIIAVSGVPRFPELRQQLLTLAERIANLPKEAKEQLEDPESRYSFGWSHGKERLKVDQPDKLKGSFYANPLVDVPTTNEDFIKRFPSYCRPNLWPNNDLPELESAFKELGRLIVDVGILLAYHCDKYVSLKDSQFEAHALENMLRNSLCHKGRLLHYFPVSSEYDNNISHWCGWHTDHGCLTGLTCAMYMKDGKEVTCPDKEAGLYVETQTGEIIKVSFKKDEIAYQVGEAAELLAHGLLHATPHYVRAAEGNDIIGLTRNTFAVFLQPHWDEPLNIVQRGGDKGDKNEPTYLNFGEFSEKTLSKYYSSSNEFILG